MMFIIDGTGDSDYKKYMQDMERGFCHQLYLKLGRQAEYMRGPTLYGFNTFDIAEEMLQKIMTYYRTGITGAMLIDPNNQKLDNIYLAGHSRGGCAVIYIAQKLKEKGINVKAMFLFDAVERTFFPLTSGESFSSDFDEIPSNVEMCYHAIRDRERVNPRKEELRLLTNKCVKAIPTPHGGVFVKDTITGDCRHLLKLEEDDKKDRALTRNQMVSGKLTFDFKNCGIKPLSSRLSIQKFKGHHGTIGGVITATSPVPDQREMAPDDFMITFQEENALLQVDRWMSENLRLHGISVTSLIHPSYPLRYTKRANSIV